MSVRAELWDSAGVTRLSLSLGHCDWPHQAKHLDSYIGAPVPAERHSFRNMASLREAARASTRSECLGPCHDLPSHMRGCCANVTSSTRRPVASLLPGLRHAVTHTLPFWVAGATLGLAFGAATMWVQVSCCCWVLLLWVQVSHCCWRGCLFTRASCSMRMTCARELPGHAAACPWCVLGVIPYRCEAYGVCGRC